MDCEVHVVGTKVVVQPVCSNNDIPPAVAGHHPHICCDDGEWMPARMKS